MKITVIGTGYVGLVAGTGFAENGHHVTCVDSDEDLIARLNEKKMPIYEPGLEELFLRNIEDERLKFTTNIDEALADCLLVFICVGTPEGKDGKTDISQVYTTAEQIAASLTGYRIVAIKSTVPIGTADAVEKLIKERTTHPFDVVSNPEFFKQGAAVDDFMRPDRIVVGCTDVRVLEIMKELYSPFLRTGRPFLSMSRRSAELAKYAVNAMLAVRISTINELAGISEAYDADINDVRQAMMADSRIGSAYLFPGLGFGSTKDVSTLATLAKEKRVEIPVIEGAMAANLHQPDRFLQRVMTHFGGNLAKKRLAIWGASFKPRTDDVRGAPSLAIIHALQNSGAELHVFDPVAGPKLADYVGEGVTIAQKMYTATQDADGLIIVTEWREFHNPDFDLLAESMREKVIFDSRNLYDPKLMKSRGFRYYSLGRPAV